MQCIFSTPTTYSQLSTFFFQSYGPHRDLHSFPTRRSSDLDFADRQKAAQRAKQNLLNKFRAQPGICSEDFARSEEHTSELQSRFDLVCRLLLEKKKKKTTNLTYINLHNI